MLIWNVRYVDITSVVDDSRQTDNTKQSGKQANNRQDKGSTLEKDTG